jgi:hypothetical protein
MACPNLSTMFSCIYGLAQTDFYLELSSMQQIQCLTPRSNRAIQSPHEYTIAMMTVLKILLEERINIQHTFVNIICPWVTPLKGIKLSGKLSKFPYGVAALVVIC